MEDFFIRDNSRICIFSQETNSYISARNPDKLKADSSHPFLLSEFAAKKQVEFIIEIVRKGLINPRRADPGSLLPARTVRVSDQHSPRPYHPRF